MSRGEGLKVSWVRAEGSDGTFVDDGFDLDDEGTKGVDVKGLLDVLGRDVLLKDAHEMLTAATSMWGPGWNECPRYASSLELSG